MCARARVCVNDRTETIIPSRRAKMATTDYVTIYIYISKHIVFLPFLNIDDESASRGVGRLRRTNENNNTNTRGGGGGAYDALALTQSHRRSHSYGRPHAAVT